MDIIVKMIYPRACPFNNQITERITGGVISIRSNVEIIDCPVIFTSPVKIFITDKPIHISESIAAKSNIKTDTTTLLRFPGRYCVYFEKSIRVMPNINEKNDIPKIVKYKRKYLS